MASRSGWLAIERLIKTSVTLQSDFVTLEFSSSTDVVFSSWRVSQYCAFPNHVGCGLYRCRMRASARGPLGIDVKAGLNVLSNTQSAVRLTVSSSPLLHAIACCRISCDFLWRSCVSDLLHTEEELALIFWVPIVCA